MADRSITYRIRAFLQGGFTVVAGEVELLGATFNGLLNGVNNALTALLRLDGTGIGARIFRFTGAYSAQNSNISEWFGGRQLNRLRCIDSGTGPSVSGAVTFDLPGTLALTTAFDQLATAGLEEALDFVIEYTGPSDDFLQIRPRAGGPVITGTSSIRVNTGVAATLQITRTSGAISDYVFVSIGGVGNGGNLSIDAIKLINPTTAIWDASSSGTLPTTGVAKGNAYLISNAPADGSGRFGEIMQDGDWAVWFGESFTSWSATPHQWFVLPAHEVRRISALESQFLGFVQTTPESDRNTVIRGADYSAETGTSPTTGIRIKIYVPPETYSAADLNTNGDISVYENPTDQSGRLGVRLPFNLSGNESLLSTLYVYSDSSGQLTNLLNMTNDFTHQGDFSGESDYLSNDTVHYNANDTWRIYRGTVQPRYTHTELDIFRDNLSDDLQRAIAGTDPSGNVDEQRLASLESQMRGLISLTTNVEILNAWADAIGLPRTVQTVTISPGYSLIADYRGSSTRYESPGVTYDDSGSNVIRYTGLGTNLYRTFGFKITAPPAQVAEITLTGAAGTANINVEGTDYLATFNTDLTTTASDFVSTHATALATAGVTVTSSAAVLTFTASVGGTPFTISAPVTATGSLGGTLNNLDTNVTLMSLVDDTTLIPFVDVTSGGTYRINNYRNNTTQGDPVRNQFHRLTLTSGDSVLNTSGNTSTYTLTNFPAGATATSRTFQIGLDVLVNGADTQAEHLQEIPLPSANTAQPRQTIDASIYLGPLHGNRTVNITIAYVLRVSGSDLLIDVSLVTAPSDVTIRPDNVDVALNYTPAATTTRVDNFITFQDAGGDYTFTGENELLVTFHPFEANNFTSAVGVAADSTGATHEFNDINVPIPPHSFASVEIPDTIDFRTFSPVHFLRHSDLSTLLADRNVQWCYGLARLHDIGEFRVTQKVDFLEGIVLIGNTNQTRVNTIVDDSDTANIKFGVQEE